MSVQLLYIASSGNEYNLKAEGVLRTLEANYHVWKWDVVGVDLQYGKRVSDFAREPAEYTSVLIFEGTALERKRMVEDLHEDFERDVRNKTPGRIVWGDYYIDCYITESSTEPGEGNIWTENEIIIFCPYPFWINETKGSFYKKETPVEEPFLDYDYDYDYDYFSGDPGSETWTRDFPFPSEFELVIYGPVTDPMIRINDHIYGVYADVRSGEYLTINSRNNTVILTEAFGKQVNEFDNRLKEQSVFEQIPGGNLGVTWDGTFSFELTLYQERSEPRWTTSS